MEYRIYTDGAYNWARQKGGWSAIIFADGKKETLKGAETATTNNRMEIMGAIKGLGHVPEGSEVTVYSDSQYLVNIMSLGWNRRANLDLWQTLDGLTAKRRVTWEWVRGHVGLKENEEANRLANQLADIPTGNVQQSKGDGRQQPTVPETHLVDVSPMPAAVQQSETRGRLSSSPATQPGVQQGQESVAVPGARPGARMVDVTPKPETARESVARGRVLLSPSTVEAIQNGQVPKGDVLTVAQVAGIMAAKQVPHILPLCHPIPLTEVQVKLELVPEANAIEIEALARTTARTGVEMEALTAVAVACLTVYDMCKGIDSALRIEAIRLVRKSGGKSGLVVLEQ